MATEPAVGAGHDEYLLAQVRESFGRVVYSHKTQEKQADLCLRKHQKLQIALVVFTAISTGTFLASLLGTFVNPQLASLVTSFVALVVTTLTLAAKNFKFGENAQAHRDIATRLWDVRESYISLISDLMSGAISTADGRARRDELQEATRAVYADAPRTTSEAYDMAQDGLKKKEEFTFRSSEIDVFLPVALRLNEGEA